MTDAPQAAKTRPIGFMKPAHPRGQLAVKALAEHRWEDARQNIQVLLKGELAERSWGLLLNARLLLVQHKLTQSCDQALQAAALAFILSSGASGSESGAAARLAAAALQQAGLTMRRHDRPDDAIRTHSAAMALRETWGSNEERWETALSLGIDAAVARRADQAEQWYARAAAFAGQCQEEGLLKSAEVEERMTALFSETGCHVQAVEHARGMVAFCREHDAESMHVARAKLILGSALLAAVEAEFRPDDSASQQQLDEATSCLRESVGELEAFGLEHLTDVRRGRDRLEVAERMRATMAPLHLEP